MDVTATDIKRGKRKEYEYCAVVRAVKRATKPLGDWPCGGICSGRVYFSGRCAINLPAAVQKFIIKFDDDMIPKSQLKPFSFTLRLPN